MSLPMNGTWTTGTPMPTGRYQGTCAAVGNRIYYACGSTIHPTGNQSISNILEIYDTENDVWISGMNAPQKVWGPGTAILDNKIYCVGGRTVSSGALVQTNIIQIYDTVSGTWEISRSTLPTARYGLKCCISDGKLYCVGGETGSSFLNSIEILNLETQTWVTGEPMPVRASWGSCIPYKDHLYWIYGYQGEATGLSKVYRYDISLDKWAEFCELPNMRYAYGCAVEGNLVYIVGGISNGTQTSMVNILNLDNGEFMHIPNKINTSQGLGCCIVNGKLHAIGGTISNSPAYGTVEIYPAESTTPPEPGTSKCCCGELDIRLKLPISNNIEVLQELNSLMSKIKGCDNSNN